MRDLSVALDRFELKAPLITSRGRIDCQTVLTVKILQDGLRGWGECVPSGSRMVSAEEGHAIAEEARDRLLTWWAAQTSDLAAIGLAGSFPRCAARNALDCALWDVKAKQAGTSVWQLLGMQMPETLTTAQTISLSDVERMAEEVRHLNHFKVIKVKLGSSEDDRAIVAIHAAAPHAKLIVDVNGGWSLDQLILLAPHMARCGVSLIEQPLAPGEDAALADYRGPVPLFADESCNDREDLPAIAQRYQGINIKLDKTGGLTEALLLCRQARAHGLEVMVGCMAGTSLSMAPASIVGSLCSFIDLDGPLLLKTDRRHRFDYSADGSFSPTNSSLWGGATDVEYGSLD
jgi:L-alanine-DL-glutamate epimerase-like enolase superfamily enzyme